MNTQFLIFIAVIEAVIALIHYVVYRSIVHYFGIYNHTGLWIFRGFMIIAAVSFCIASLITARGWSPEGHVFYTVSAVWLGLVIWLFFAAIVCVIVDPILKHFINSEVVYWGARATVALICFLGAVGLNLYGLVNQARLKVVEYDVVVKNLPNEWIGRKAVLLADTHFGNVRGAEYAKEIIAKVRAINPDIMFISGDFYDGPPMPYEAPAVAMGSFQPNLGIYYVTGNHEEYGNREDYIGPIKRAGITVLDDQSVNVKGVNVVGVSYRTTSGKDSQGRELFPFTLSKALQTGVASTNAPTILLKHVPLGVAEAEGMSVDLMLSGHSHHGQMWPFNYITNAIFNGFDYGLNSYRNLQVITTSGAGTWGPPQRIGSNNEIVVIKFK